MSNFDEAFKYVLGDEGGYTNDANDSGGPTNWGITIADLSRYLHRPATIREVKAMTKDTAKAIYRAWYWNTLSLDQIADSAKATAIFDIGVVCGIYQGALIAQKACNALGSSLDLDGHIGPKSLVAINTSDHKNFITWASNLVANRFRAIASANPKDRVFLHGWLNRAHRLLTLIADHRFQDFL